MAGNTNPASGLPERATPPPHFVQIEPVGQCNLRCRMCPIQFRPESAPGHPPAHLPYDAFCRLVDQFPELRELHLQGMGEPLLHPHFFAMVAYASARGIAVSTNTNLTVLSEQRARVCVRSGLRRMHVSLDAPNAASYERIRVRARFDRVLRNLARLIAAKDALGSALPEIGLVMVIMRGNLHELPALVALARELGVGSLSVQHLCHDFTEETLPARYRTMRESVEQETLLHEDPARIERFFAEARAAADALGVALRLPNPRPRPHAAGLSGRSRCDWPWRGTYISYAGDAMPCCMVATPDRISFGNMRRESVAGVWHNGEYEAFRDRLEAGPPPDVCRGCALYAGRF